MRPAPYVGVAGVMSQQEVAELLSVLPPNPARKLSPGILVSRKTLRGQKNAWPSKYPTTDKLGTIFVDDPRCLNLVHYSQGDEDGLLENLCQAYEAGGPFCHGVQLNYTLPDRDILAQFALRYPSARVVLQLGPKTLATVDPERIEILLLGLSTYSWIITDVLIDGSAGTGKALDAAFCGRVSSGLRRFHPGLGIGLAGGLGSHASIQAIAPILTMVPGLSTDAEGQLRDGEFGGKLNLTKAKNYVRDVLALHTSNC